MKKNNNIFKKHIEYAKSYWYENIPQDWSYDFKNVDKQKFTEYAYHQIDLFIKYLYESMSKEYGDSNKNILLCNSICNILKENLYNDSVSTFNLFNNIFQIPEDTRDDHGQIPAFSYSYNDNLILFGTDLVIQVIFDNFQGNDFDDTFQIRCHYDQMEGQYNEYFDEYFANSTSFLTTDDFDKFYELDDDEICEDAFSIAIVELSNVTVLRTDLYYKNDTANEINNFINAMNNIIID